MLGGLHAREAAGLAQGIGALLHEYVATHGDRAVGYLLHPGMGIRVDGAAGLCLTTIATAPLAHQWVALFNLPAMAQWLRLNAQIVRRGGPPEETRLAMLHALRGQLDQLAKESAQALADAQILGGLKIA